jgi:hypothetical protein
MSVDLLSETRISLNQLAREQGVSLSTSWRWTLRGIRGYRLESLNVGGRKFTTREAFARFVASTNGDPTPVQMSVQREAQRRLAKRELQEAGLL